MIFFFTLSLLRITMVLVLLGSWLRIKLGTNLSKSIEKPTFTVLVPIRNEAQNIISLLSDLEIQDYPVSLFEVIVVDDHSEDDSAELVKRFAKKSKLSIRILELTGDPEKGKKRAITKGVAMANNIYIIATDGDCRLPNSWISAYASAYQVLDPPYLVTGPVFMETVNTFTGVQALEFSTLIGYGASSLSMGVPGTCNGANLSYKKSIFESLHGYKGNENIPSGDDEFLMLKTHRTHPGKVQFLKDKRVIVMTPAKKNLKELVNQRIRWSSKWKFHKSYYITGSAMLFFLDYLFLLTAIYFLITGGWSWSAVSVILIVRWLADYTYIFNISKFLGSNRSLFHFLIMQIIYPIFVIFLGIASIFGNYQWKGRSYS